MGKRGKEEALEEEVQAKRQRADDEAKKEFPASEQPDDVEEGDDFIMMPKSTSRVAVRKGNECPYLDSVSRQVLYCTALHCTAWVHAPSSGLAAPKPLTGGRVLSQLQCRAHCRTWTLISRSAAL